MEFNLNDIFKNAFGYEAPAKFTVPAAAARLEQSQVKGGSSYYGEDVLGREFFMPVTLSGSFTTKNSSTPFSFLIPFAVLSVNCRKTIVETPMVERGGSVSELIATDDYVINVKGIFINDDNAFPEQEIIDIHDIFKVNAAITMRSVLSDIFLRGESDHSVIIRELKFPANAAVEHAKPFEIDCKSDIIFTLEV